MKRRKGMRILALILIRVLMIQTFSVQAASSDGYVTPNSSSVKIGGYQIKVTFKNGINSLYTRNGTSGKWKKIASGLAAAGVFTTNGANIYYAKSTYSYISGNGSSKIYCISVNGGKSKHITTIPNAGILAMHRYKDNLYLTEFRGKGSPYPTYVYSLKTKKHTLFKENLDINGAYKGYAVMNEHYYKWTVPLYAVNLTTKKIVKTLASNSYKHYVSGKYVYYTDYTTSLTTTRPEEWKNGIFTIKRATVDGKNITAMTSNITGAVQSVTAHSVTYTDKNDITRTIKY